MVELDLFFLATQGQFSPDRSIYWAADGYYIYSEESIIRVPSDLGYAEPDRRKYVEKKKITIHVNVENEKFSKTFILDDINLTVRRIEYTDIENIINVYISNVESDDIIKVVKVTLDL